MLPVGVKCAPKKRRLSFVECASSPSRREVLKHVDRRHLPLPDDVETDEADQATRDREWQREKSAELIIVLLEQVAASVSSFRPSKSLAALSQHKDQLSMSQKELHPLTEIDVVISGGGFKGMFMAGAGFVLNAPTCKRELVIRRIAGASAGAWSGLFLCCGFDLRQWLHTYYACMDRPDATVHEVYESLIPWVKTHLPANAYELCSDRLFVSITVWDAAGPRNLIVSHFLSNDDLIQACLASSALPFLTERGICRRFRGMLAADGCFSNNTPVFTDGVRRQLVFRLWDIEYPFRLLINPADSCIESLVLRGALLMARFLQGGHVDSIVWLLEKEKAGSKGPGLGLQETAAAVPRHLRELRATLWSTVRARRVHWVRVGIIAPLSLGAVIVYRATGLKALLQSLPATGDGARAVAATLVDFHDSAHVFATMSGWQYALGAAFAAIVSNVRDMLM